MHSLRLPGLRLNTLGRSRAARQNLLSFTEDFTSPGWAKSTTAIAAQTAVRAARGGLYNRLTATGSFARAVQPSVPAPPLTQHTLSFTARRVGTQQTFSVLVTSHPTTGPFLFVIGNFGVPNAQLSATGFTSTSISFTIIAPDEMFVSVTFTTAVDTARLVVEPWIGPYNGINYAPGAVDFSSFQLELGAVVTPYQAILGGQNLLPFAADFANPVAWGGAGSFQNGLTVARTPGIDAQGPFIDLRYTGTPIAPAVNVVAYVAGLALGLPWVPAAPGQSWTGFARIERTGGSRTGVNNFALSLYRGNASSVYIDQTDVFAVNDPAQVYALTRNNLAAGTGTVLLGLILYGQAGVAVDVTFRVRELHLIRIV